MSSNRDASREEVIVSEAISELRGRVRLLTWLSGLSWTLLVLCGGMLVTGVLDWLVHFDDPVLRLVLGLTLLVTSSYMMWRHLLWPLNQPLSSSFLAARIERRFPGLRSRVLSAVEFLHHRIDSRVGSQELQQAVVSLALQDLERIEPRDIVETKSIRTVTFASSVILAVAIIIVALCPVEAATSVKRLVLPFTNTPWPRRFNLLLVKPDFTVFEATPDRPILIARGETLELYVIDSRGRLPERVWLEQRHIESQVSSMQTTTEEHGPPSPIVREALRQTTIPDKKGKTREAAMVSWIASRGAYEFRVTGGDDDSMKFFRVEVVDPPAIESLQLEVTPPSYAGKQIESLPPGVGHVSGLVGTSIKATASADKPLKSAQLRIGDKPAQALVIDDDSRSFTATFSITEPGVTAYFFELTDEAGFIDRESPRYELRGVADLVPEVVIESPVADVMLAPDAELDVKVFAKDDLGLNNVRLAYRLNDEVADRTIPLFPKSESKDIDENSQRAPIALDESNPASLSLNHLWRLAPLSLEPGNRIVFRAEAADGFNLTSEGHVGRSTPRTITIVSKDEKQKELAERVSELLEDLRDAAVLQNRAKEQTGELQTQLSTTGQLRPQDVDQLHRIELDQRQAASRLTHPADGVQEQARLLKDEFQANKLSDSETQERLDRIVDELSRLGKDQFPAIERALTTASKQAEESVHQSSTADSKTTESGKGAVTPLDPKGKESNPKSPEKQPIEQQAPTSKDRNDGVSSPLKDAQAQQKNAVDTLQDLQDLLVEWRDRRDVSKDLNSLIAEQEGIQKESAELGASTQTKPDAELTAQDRADLAKLAARQRKLADQVDQFRRQLDQMAGSVKPRDADAAERFEEARDELAKEGTAGTLREAASDINENKFGEASQAQQQAMKDLKSIERQLKREPSDDIETLIKQVEQAMSEFEELKKTQNELLDQAQKAAGQPDSPERREQTEILRQKQQNLQDQLAQAERKLERLRLHSAADAAARAQERLENVDRQLQDPDQIDDAAEEMKEVLEELDQVERDLAEERRIAEERLATEQLEKIEDQLKGLLIRQQTVIAETERLEAERREKGNLSRGQLKSLRDLAETERGLHGEVTELEKSLTSAEVFALVLRRMARSIDLASTRLSDKLTDAATIALEKDVVKKIESLLDVLKQDADANAKKADQAPMPPDDEKNGERKPENSGPPGESLPQVAQLKMLKLLQEEYLDRTKLLNDLRDKDGNLSQEATSELDQLAKEQDELAELTRNLIVKLLQSRPEPEDEATEGRAKQRGDDLKQDGEGASQKNKDSEGVKSDDKSKPTKKDQPKTEDPIDLDKALDLDKLLDEDKPTKKVR